jgi:DNA polymerase III alpha subunit (gram-positive type)
MSILVADIETDGLRPTCIWMVGVLDYETMEFTPYVGDDVAEGLIRIQEADLVIGHNFRGYDKKYIEVLTESMIQLEDDNIHDTLEIARKLFPELKTHKLSEWGEILGYPKLEYDDFGKFHADMIPYCERDCVITKHLYDFLLTQLDRKSQ